MARTLNILSGGAAQALVKRVQPAFEARHDCRLEGTFGAVGLMKDKLVAGAPCDLLVLSQALVEELAAAGRADAASARAVGVVNTGLALKDGRAAVAVRTEQDLQALLRAAPAIYFPDPAKATAGIHFMKVLKALGLAGDAAKLRVFPNGSTAMAELARDPDAQAVGCTQVTEILMTPGVHLTGLLPPPHGLATTYAAAISATAREPELARELIAVLTSPEAAQARGECGFE